MNKMLPIKTIILTLTIIPFLLSCSKKEGCNFNEALNYDNLVVIDDGSCTFTNFTFYADTTHYTDTTSLNGVFIEQIDIKIVNELIGTFTGMESLENVCGGLNTVSYIPRSVESVSWTSEIHLLDSFVDTVIITSGTSRTSPDIECLEINVLR